MRRGVWAAQTQGNLTKSDVINTFTLNQTFYLTIQPYFMMGISAAAQSQGSLTKLAEVSSMSTHQLHIVVCS